MLKKPWEGRIKPGKMFDNLYFVGTVPASSHLIDTTEGLILLDTGYFDSLYILLNNIWEVGFNPKDIKYIVISHAHLDHMDSVSALVELTGAKTFIGKDDLPLLKGEIFHYPIIPFEPDVLLSDGDTITLGNTTIECIATPGHTNGTMSFFFDVYEGDKKYRAGMFGGTGANTLRKDFILEHNLSFEGRDKYFKSLDRLWNEKVDVFVGNHVQNNNTVEKLEKMGTAPKNPFINPLEWQSFLSFCHKKLTRYIKEENGEN